MKTTLTIPMFLAFFMLFGTSQAQQVETYTRQLWNNNQWNNSTRTLYAYDADWLVQETQQYYDVSQQLWTNSTQEEHYYTLNGDIDSTIRYIWKPSTEDWVFSSKEKYTYDSQGNALSKLHLIWQDEMWKELSRKVNTYDSKGNLLSEESENWNEKTESWSKMSRDEYHWNGMGKMDEVTHLFWRSDLNKMVNSKRTVFTFNTEGNLTSEIDFNWSNGQWVGFNRTTISYQSKILESNRLVENWDQKNKVWVHNYRHTYTYDLQSHLTLEVKEVWDGGNGFWRNNGKTEFSNNPDGSVDDKVVFYWDAINASWLNSTKESYEYKKTSTAISDYSSNSYRVYPNPSSGTIYVESDDVMPEHQLVQVYSITGNLVHSTVIENNTLNLDELEAGQYIMKLGNSQESKAIRFVKSN